MVSTKTTIGESRWINQYNDNVYKRYDLIPDSNSTIQDLKVTKGIDVEFLVAVLNYFSDSKELTVETFEQYSTPVLVDYLERSHEFYRSQKLCEIEQSINNQLVSSTDQKGLFTILNLFFSDYQTNLIAHFEMEENSLFPYARELYNGFPKLLKKEINLSIKSNAKDFLNDHEKSGLELNKVRQALSNFIPLESGKSMFRVLLEQLRNFEKDLQLHEFIEEKILIPRLIEMENCLLEVG